MLDKIISNLKKRQTEKFKFLVSIFDKIKKINNDISDCDKSINFYINEQNISEKENSKLILIRDFKIINNKLEILIKFISTINSKYKNEKIEEDINKILNSLQIIFTKKEILNLIPIIERQNILLKEFKVIKNSFESIQSQVLLLLSKPLNYFENKKEISISLKEQRA